MTASRVWENRFDVCGHNPDQLDYDNSPSLAFEDEYHEPDFECYDFEGEEDAEEEKDEYDDEAGDRYNAACGWRWRSSVPPDPLPVAKGWWSTRPND